MMRTITSTMLLLAILSWANCYSQISKVWDQMETNDYVATHQLLDNNITNNVDVVESYITKILLNSLEGRGVDKNLGLMKKAFPLMEMPSPYLYSIWYNSAVTNGYGKMDKDRLEFIKQISSDPKLSGTLHAASLYAIGHHYMAINNTNAAKKEWTKIGAISNWQFAGVFDNTSGSGFDKDYRPVKEANPSTSFRNKNGASVDWFTPNVAEQDPWVTFQNVLPSSQGVVYAQSFITVPEDQEITLALGAEGNIKLWINDQLVFTEERERRTEMDYYKKKVILPKGTNRVLAQVGHTANTNHPSFSLRLLNEEGQPITNIGSSAKFSEYNKDRIELKNSSSHFAEHFFEEQIKKDSNNVINHLLLAKCYNRAKKNNQAIRVLRLANSKFPNNVLINNELLKNYQDINDRTELLKQVEHIRNVSPDLLFLDYYDYEIAKTNEDIDEMISSLDKIEDRIGSNRVSIYKRKIELAGKQQDFPKMTSLIMEAVRKHPENSLFVQYHYAIQKQKAKGGSAPYYILENFLKKRYDFKTYQLLVNEYQESGKKDKALKTLLKLHQSFPQELEFIDQLLYLYYSRQDFEKAMTYCNKSLAIAPYRSSEYTNRAFVNLALGNQPQAERDLERAVSLDPNSFESREKLRELQGKESLITFLRNPDTDDMIEAGLKEEDNSNEQYKYVFFERNHIQFEEGSGVEYTNLGIKILNESGIEAWQEASIPVNYYWENLVIEHAEVRKKNGQKVEGERNYNEIVFPSLEVGDIVHFEYRKDMYTGGQLAQELTLEYVFSAFAPVENSVFRLYVPKVYDIQQNHRGIDAEVVKTEVDEFKCYEWKYASIDKVKDENYMPTVAEVGKSLNFSTIPSWKVISNWYMDLALPMAKEDYNLNQAYSEIFDGNTFDNKLDKHKAIYEYLCDNIKYSSVSFRQSNYVPQKPMITLSTKLGDCKDLSTLYHTLAKKAGLETNLVLVNTRENGQEGLVMPSTGFNHCIVRVADLDEPLFLELTDNQLPFGAMTHYIENAQALVIPNDKSEDLGNELITIPNNSTIPNTLEREVDIVINEEALSLETTLTASGTEAANFRYYFSDLTPDEIDDQVDSYVSGFFENDFKIASKSFENLNDRTNEVKFSISLTVEDVVKSIGAMQTFVVPFFEEIVTLDRFPNETREHPLNYWEYETVDKYRTNITITIPDGYAFVEIPENLNIDNEFISYELLIEKVADNKLKITRNAIPNSSTFNSESYESLRNSIKQVLKAEDMYIAYKEVK